MWIAVNNRTDGVFTKERGLQLLETEASQVYRDPVENQALDIVDEAVFEDYLAEPGLLVAELVYGINDEGE